MFTKTYLPSISPISGSRETKLTKYETDKHHTCYNRKADDLVSPVSTRRVIRRYAYNADLPWLPKLTFISMINTTSERLKARNFLPAGILVFYEQLKFRAQLS